MGFVRNYLANCLHLARGDQPERPLLFSYYVTHRCSLNCRYCCDGDGKRFKEDPRPELPVDEAAKLFALLARASDTLDVTGGEPLIRDDLEDILFAADQAGMRVVLNTKGIGLPSRPGVYEACDLVVVSVDSLSTPALARVMGAPTAVAEQLLADLRVTLERRRDYGFGVVLSSVATVDNLEDIRGVLAFAREHGCGFHLSPEIVGTRPDPALRGHAGYRALMREVANAKRDGAAVLGIRDYLEGIRDFDAFPCHPLLMPVIRPDGRMYYPCLEAKQAEIRLADFPDYPAALAEARRRYGPIPPCGDCCHIFCHMALSLLQRRPGQALLEGRTWRRIRRA